MKQDAGVRLIGLLAIGEAAWIGASFLLHDRFLSISTEQARGMASVFAIAGCAVLALAGTGLLKLERWARSLSSTLAALYAFDPVHQLWVGAKGFTPVGAIFFYADNIVALAIAAWIVWYLSQARIRALFEKRWTSITELR